MVDVNQLQMPVANQAAADRATTASQARVQANTDLASTRSRAAMQSKLAVTSGQAMMKGPAIAQQSAGIQAQEQAKIAATEAQANLRADVGQAQQALHATDLRMKEQQTNHMEAMARRHAAQRNAMSAMGRDIKKELLDDQLQFDKTARETRFATDRQFADFMFSKQRDENALKEYEREVNAAIERDIIMTEAAFNTLVMEEQHQFKLDEHKRDMQLIEQIREYKAALEAKARRARRKKNGMSRMTGAVKVAAGATMMYYTGGTVGSNLVIEGGMEYAGAEGADDDVALSAGNYEREEV